MTDPTLPRADTVLGEKLPAVMNGHLDDQHAWDMQLGGEVLAAALFACLPPDSDHLVVRRSDLAVMGLEQIQTLGDLLGYDADGVAGDIPTLYRLVAPGSPTVPESEA